MNRVTGRARTIVIAVLGGVSHVGHVVGGVEVHTIPARWEEDLRTESIRAWLVRKLVVVVGCTAVVQADEADSLTGKVVGVSTLVWITSKHAEVFGKGLERVVGRTTTLQVVDDHTTVNTSSITGLGHVDELAILGAVVEVRNPVV